MRKRKTVLSCLLLLSMTLAACSNQDAMTIADEQTAPVPVEVAAVEEGIIEENTMVTGKLTPSSAVQVSAKVSGKISQIHVSAGQQVEQGDVLFTLDQTDLANQVKLAQAAYDLAAANLKQSETSSAQGIEQAEHNVIQTKNGVIQAENAMAQAEQAFAEAQTNESRMKPLCESGAITLVEYEKAQSALTNAGLALENAKAGVVTAQSAHENAKKMLGHGQQRTAVRVAQASVAQAQVQLQNALDQLENAAVKAPISGIVAAVQGVQGELASPQVPVITIVNIDSLRVKAHLSEQEITNVQLGNRVRVDVPAANKEVEATIQAISPIMDEQLKAYPIEILIPNSSQELREIWLFI